MNIVHNPRTEKKCARCRETFPASVYRKLKVKKGHTLYINLSAYCPPCDKAVQKEWRLANKGHLARRNRNAYLKRTFGITSAQYDHMLAEQGGGCAVCGGKAPAGRSLAVDHNHETGRIRGILCYNCNDGLGRFMDDSMLLHSAANYLDRHL